MTVMNDSGVLQRLTDRELWLITSRAGERRGGLIATNVTSISIVESLPRYLVGLGQRHFTHELIGQSHAFAMHLLAEEHLDWVERFALSSGRDHDKFAGLDVQTGPSGSPVLPGAVGWFDCLVEATMDTGDRTVFLAEVVQARANDPRTVLTASRVIELVSGDVRKRLKAAFQQDATLDAEAIRAWRSNRPQSTGAM